MAEGFYDKRLSRRRRSPSGDHLPRQPLQGGKRSFA
jgi:hypothetical protein